MPSSLIGAPTYAQSGNGFAVGGQGGATRSPGAWGLRYPYAQSGAAWAASCAPTAIPAAATAIDPSINTPAYRFMTPPPVQYMTEERYDETPARHPCTYADDGRACVLAEPRRAPGRGGGLRTRGRQRPDHPVLGPRLGLHLRPVLRRHLCLAAVHAAGLRGHDRLRQHGAAGRPAPRAGREPAPRRRVPADPR